MLSTVALLRASSEVDGFAASCLPYMFIFFVPMCVAGQRLQDASQAVATAVYNGSWLEKDPPARRCQLLVMAVCARPATFTVPGLMSLNLPTCRVGLRSWFQFTQVLINVKT
ncbi:hypothetical protein ONE63_009543 [Megalurothrips usitatus]|uniref:Uncharacterized protein n=1 Tax=Megalurothrips usitatus TaxID=439358 RepID=A0AAV7XRJ5_9NEOP|nr:hypothetical protein ONE63_009543 [Megalurothrips usitatus]